MFKKYTKYEDKINNELNGFQEIADFEAEKSDLIVVNYQEKQRKSAKIFFYICISCYCFSNYYFNCFFILICFYTKITQLINKTSFTKSVLIPKTLFILDYDD